ncbi:MAG: putative transposase [Limisphaerales bacterium]|jgi:REP element-mobilizing transposase RayT
MPGKIPHDPITQRLVHITYRLLGSIPKAVEEQLKLRRDKALSEMEVEIMSLPKEHRAQARHQRKFLISGKYELALDDAIHQAVIDNPMFLAQEGVAEIIINSWFFLQESGIYIYAICVMSNHVHLVVRALDEAVEVPIGQLIGRHKSFTAHKINGLFKREEQGVWNRTYFDRRVRTGRFSAVIWYVLNNPVKAGLVDDWRDWPGTYLNADFDELFQN